MIPAVTAATKRTPRQKEKSEVKEGDVYYRTTRSYPHHQDIADEVTLTVVRATDQVKGGSPPYGRRSAERRPSVVFGAIREETPTPGTDKER